MTIYFFFFFFFIKRYARGLRISTSEILSHSTKELNVLLDIVYLIELRYSYFFCENACIEEQIETIHLIIYWRGACARVTFIETFVEKLIDRKILLSPFATLVPA